ncbi:DNA internalization-related competence protein ComEC/Rec2 [Cupriavidus agavae]|uniref:Competence protein ComEC n=1 Tax=Cupriavidus agavae TaxID=1001822 RepID=A0A4V2FI52_9BURK|nr:DNA internalization-related competence protein ComEC/Rec2 [Cupriavidus agavae]RZT42569.1 competence protein ComEC [Cupriavidus agavae]
MRVLLLAFVAGCWWLQQQGALPSAWWLLVAACAAAAACAVGRLRAPVRWTAGVALAVLAGFSWAAWRAEVRLGHWLDPSLAGRELSVTGIVAGLPDAAPHGTRFAFLPSHWEGQGETQFLAKRLLLTWRDAPEGLEPGQHYRLTVRLRRPRGLANPHGFDYGYWLLAQGFDATGHVRAGAFVADAGDLPLAVRIARWRAGLRDHLRQALPPDARFGAVLVALVIGDQRGIAREDWEVFRRTGISHLVSISGLHITMLSGAAGALAGWGWRRSFGFGRWLGRTRCASCPLSRLRERGANRRLRLIPLPLLWPSQKAALVVAVATGFAYAAIAGMQIPALRTVTMLTVAAVALWSGRAPPASVVLAWAAALAVAIDPWAVMSPGFWLSFGAVAVIFFHASRADEAGRERAPEGWAARLRASIASAARTQWAVTIGLVPLTLLLFGQVSVVSGLANAVAIPVVSLLVTPLALFAAVAPAGLAPPLLAIAHGALAWLVQGLAWLAAPSWAVWEAAQAGPLAFGLAWLGVVVLLVPRGPQGRAPPRWTGAVLMVPMLAAGRTPVPHGEFRLTALDVGQGTAVLVETRDRTLLYDAGPVYVSGTSAGGQVIVPFLRASGVRRLDMLMVSHEDADHAGGVADVLGAVPVAARLTAAPPDHRLLAPGQTAGQTAGWRPCLAGAAWTWDGVSFDILHPSPADLNSSRLSSNARSCVLRVSTGRRSALLTGDIGEREELALTRRLAPGALRADYLLVPHHGSGTSSSRGFLGAVRPELAVFQLGFGNRYRHPRDDVWRRYARAGIARYRSDETGAVTIETRGEGQAVATYRQQHRRYWRDVVAAPR